MQGLVGHHDAIGIGIEPLAGPDQASLHLDSHIALPLTCTGCGHWRQDECADAQGCGPQFANVPDGAVDHDTRPAIARRRCRNVAANQCSRNRPCAIHQQHLARAAFLLQDLLDQGVVFMTAHRHHLPGEGTAAAKVLKHRREHAKQAAVIVFVRVTEITGRKINVHGYKSKQNSQGSRATKAWSGPL